MEAFGGLGDQPAGGCEAVGYGVRQQDTARLVQQTVVDRDDGEVGLGHEMGVQAVIQAGAADHPAAAVDVEDHPASRA